MLNWLHGDDYIGRYNLAFDALFYSMPDCTKFYISTFAMGGKNLRSFRRCITTNIYNFKMTCCFTPVLFSLSIISLILSLKTWRGGPLYKINPGYNLHFFLRVTGNEFCRASTLCPMTIQLEQLNPAPHTSLFYEVSLCFDIGST